LKINPSAKIFSCDIINSIKFDSLVGEAILTP